MNKALKGQINYNQSKYKYVIGGIIGSIIGLVIGIFISKVVIIDVLPNYSEDFKDFKEVVLIVSNQVVSELEPKKEPGFLSKLIPKCVKNFVGKTVGKVKVKLFYTFKWDPIPIHIKILGILIPIFIIIICVKISTSLGKSIEKNIFASFKS